MLSCLVKVGSHLWLEKDFCLHNADFWAVMVIDCGLSLAWFEVGVKE